MPLFSGRGLLIRRRSEQRTERLSYPNVFKGLSLHNKKNSLFHMETSWLGAESNSIGESYVSGTYINLFFSFLTEGCLAQDGGTVLSRPELNLVTKIKRRKQKHVFLPRFLMVVASSV